jgi:hypothetical protein
MQITLLKGYSKVSFVLLVVFYSLCQCEREEIQASDPTLSLHHDIRQ